MTKKTALGMAVVFAGVALLTGCTAPKAGNDGAVDIFDSIGNPIRGVSANTHAKCIVPVRTKQFRGDHVCDVAHPVWSDASGEESLTRDRSADPVAAREHEPSQSGWEHSDTRDPSGPVSDEEARLALAWDRYCDGGWGMTDEDWKLIEGRDVPDHITNCNPPK
ncbi:hypothetical protein [Thioalkalivibrio sp. ALgr3]|uniref:hypothetical protein n=1 Tax=Thioalkalivibrio sp. ALgr3 TaxID=1239292 RepID=UPI0003693741|nr:hypothetical protein [Thioalkalivibrio sp. ALgr3]